jgi:hypothetical protein
VPAALPPCAVAVVVAGFVVVAVDGDASVVVVFDNNASDGCLSWVLECCCEVLIVDGGELIGLAVLLSSTDDVVKCIVLGRRTYEESS